MAFSILLFFAYFIVACCLISANSEPQECQEISQFITEVKEAFSEAFDPEPEVIPILCLPPARTRHRNQVAAISNPVLVTPAPQSDCFPLPNTNTLRSLRQYVREHNLQAVIKDKVGKSVSNCSKTELLAAIS